MYYQRNKLIIHLEHTGKSLFFYASSKWRQFINSYDITISILSDSLSFQLWYHCYSDICNLLDNSTHILWMCTILVIVSVTLCKQFSEILIFIWLCYNSKFKWYSFLNVMTSILNFSLMSSYMPRTYRNPWNFFSVILPFTCTGKTQYNEVLGTITFCLLYQIFCYIIIFKQCKTKQIVSLGPEKTVCYIRYFVISNLFISSFHCIYSDYMHAGKMADKI